MRSWEMMPLTGERRGNTIGLLSPAIVPNTQFILSGFPLIPSSALNEHYPAICSPACYSLHVTMPAQHI